ncbi:Voltage-dependent L-type calcium channel domain-containing protein [Phytophthora infestans]|uniref:Voltage-dependent L-type calcium channel domain-containing protein n=2 Tax=Phytophthora infestans TaxID=4787 RepID=A0A8S9TXF0_PHYIN|nr:Voltage-dependent L-type calcium channel domain-containing protein [Phytophthora infestans]
MSSELRHRSKSMHGTTTGLLLKKFQLDSQRSHAITQARSKSTVKLQVETDSSIDVIQEIINAAPGCYPGDDGSSEIADRYNFFVHRKRFLFAPCSLGIFPERSRFRQALIWCITWKRFDQFILFLILANSIILAIADYSKVDNQGDLDSSQSTRNAIVTSADTIFTILFAVECTMKIIAMGLIGDQGAYLMDPWNWMDFIVVFIGILAVIPGIPNVSMLRVFRVLRPLRSLNAVAGMKKLVSALLKSIPELLTVVAFLCFLFFLYGVIGVQLWSGVLHPRCRITPYPVYVNPDVKFGTFDEYKATVLANYSLFPCVDEYNDQIPLSNASWSHDTSPWRTPRQCFWPVADETPARTCSLGDDQFRQCPDGQICGSDYDDFGNFRFTHPDSLIVQRVLQSSTYSSDLNWGFLHFDSIGSASLAIFQCITREGWSDIMYMLQDAGYGTVAVIYFVSFIIFGSFFMLNLTLAVIWDNFSEASFLEAEERKTQKKARALTLALRAAQAASDGASPSRVQSLFGAIVNHWMFNVVQTTLILLNTIILSLDQYPIDKKLNETVEKINFALTLAFFIEALLKVVGLGWKRWRDDRYNQFDAVIVVVSTVELILSPPAFIRQQGASSTASSFSGLRSFRLFALFKLARSWPSLQKLLTTMISTLQEVGNFSVLFLLFLYIYALIGMQTFANQFRFDEYGYPVDRNHEAAYIPRANFDTLLWSVVTVFQILTGENWNVVMMDGWRSSGWSAVLYFVSLVVLGNFIVLNLFLAILLGNFDESNDEERDAQREALKRKSRVAPTTNNQLSSRRDVDYRSSTTEERSRSRTLSRSRTQSRSRLTVGGRREALATSSRMFHELPGAVRRHGSSFLKNRLGLHRSLFILALDNPIRKLATRILLHPQFDNFSLALIIVSTIELAIDNPLSSPDSLLTNILSWFDAVLTVLFMIEVAIKIIAYGFVLHKGAYLRNSWNLMDFVITATAAFFMFQGSSQFKFVKTLRTFRALRPLRMINRNPGLKLVVSSLIASIPQIVNVIMVCLLVFMIFSILAVNNLKGKFYSCQGNVFAALSSAQQAFIASPRPWTNLTVAEQTWFNHSTAEVISNLSSDGPLTSRAICNLFGAAWDKTIPQNFDNVIHGIQTFFEMTTTEGWVTIMLTSVDATEIDMQPIPNHHESWAFFFICFILVGTFFVMQLFVGVVIENFNNMKEKLDGTFHLSQIQREWLTINDAMLNLRPVRKLKTPRHTTRRALFRIALSPTLELLIIGCVLLNTVFMAMDYFGEEDLYETGLNYLNYFFSGIFALEAVVKIIGLGKYYWKEPWNIFDFIVVLGTLFGVIYQMFGGSSIGTAASTVRSFRVGRLFRLVHSAPSLRQLFNTLLITLPSLANIGGLLFLVFFIYAAMGVQLFAKIKFGDLITSTANFQSLLAAMITLVRCATGERWNDVMYELANQKDCVPDPPYDPNSCGISSAVDCVPLNGCGSPVAFVYLYSFTLLVTFILLNIFIAVILEGFAKEKDRQDGVLLPQHYETFVKKWCQFDPEATGFLEWHLLPSFVATLEPPMGVGTNLRSSSKDIQVFVAYLDVPIFRDNKVFFNDVARRVGKFVIDELSDQPLEALPKSLNLEKRWRKYLAGRNIRKSDISVHRLNQFSAAALIHRSVNALIFREELNAGVQLFEKRSRSRVTSLVTVAEQ